MRYQGRYPDFGLRYYHAFDDHPLPECDALSHVGELRCERTRQLGTHAHDGFEICYVISGQLLRTFGAGEVVVHPGECFISPPGECHGGGTDPERPCHYVTVVFDPWQLSWQAMLPGVQVPDSAVPAWATLDSTRDLLGRTLQQRLTMVGPGAEAIFRRILFELETMPQDDVRGRQLGAAMIQTHLLEVVILVMRAQHRQSQGGALARAVTPTVSARAAFVELVSWLSSRLADPPTLAEMAHRARLSAPHFCNAFRQEFGESPVAYLNHLRLAAAARELTDGHLPVRAVAEGMGFRSPQYFASVFRKHYGVTPREWRERQLRR